VSRHLPPESIRTPHAPLGDELAMAGAADQESDRRY